MTTVVRRNGTREDFIEERIRRALRKAAIDPGLSANRHSETVESAVRMATERAQAREETTSRDIREGMLSDLDRTAPGVTASWRSFDVNYRHITRKDSSVHNSLGGRPQGEGRPPKREDWNDQSGKREMTMIPPSW